MQKRAYWGWGGDCQRYGCDEGLFDFFQYFNFYSGRLRLSKTNSFNFVCFIKYKEIFVKDI